MNYLKIAGVVIGMALLGACSKAPEKTAQDPGPDNAATRYAENLVSSEQKAQRTADKANALIANQSQQVNQQ